MRFSDFPSLRTIWTMVSYQRSRQLRYRNPETRNGIQFIVYSFSFLYLYTGAIFYPTMSTFCTQPRKSSLINPTLLFLATTFLRIHSQNGIPFRRAQRYIIRDIPNNAEGVFANDGDGCFESGSKYLYLGTLSKS